MATPQGSNKERILDNHQNVLKEAAREAVTKNIVDLNKAVSQSFENVILACEEKDLITSDFRQQLLHAPYETRLCIKFIDWIQTTVGLNPAYLDTFLSILHNKGPATSEVAKSVAKHYGYALPKYEEATNASLTATDTVGGATIVISSDDNVEEMVPQMSSEDRTSDILRTHYSTLLQSLKDPVNIARLLHGENVISEDAVTQVNSAAIKDRTTVLLGSIRKAIHDNHQHLKVFGRVLQQLTAGNERVGQDILNDYNKVFLTTSIFSMTSTSSTTTVQSSTGAEATDVRHHITRDMEEEFSAIRGKFARTFHKVKKTLTKHNISLADVKNFCKFAFAKSSQEINDCQTMEDVLTFVATKCTLINISILKELIDDCEIDEAKQHIQDYQQAIDDFSQKMRARFPLNQSLLPDGIPHPLRGETITFVMKWDSKNVSLDDIEDLQTYAFGSLFENVNVIQMKPTKSVVITCSFPFELTGLLMAEAMKNLKLLKKHGLLRLTIGYCTIWNIRDEEEALQKQIVNEPHRPSFHREDSRQIPPAVTDQKENSSQTDELPENIVTKDSYQANHGRFLIFSCFVIITVAVVFIALFIGYYNKYHQEEIDTLNNKWTSCKEENEKCLYARDCKEWYEIGITKSDIYPLKPDNGPSFKVYCDMETEGGGWTVFQRRQDGSVDFYRDWIDYEKGFGTLSGEHWLGLSKLYRLTLDTSNTLRVDLGDFDNKRHYAQYNTFQISDSNSQYAITVSGYSGRAGDSLEAHNSMKFSTKDIDNDAEPTGDNCAKKFKGAWWYSGCHESNLNGQYKKRSECITEKGHGLIWNTWKGYEYSLKFTEMKVRRN